MNNILAYQYIILMTELNLKKTISFDIWRPEQVSPFPLTTP